MSGKSKLTAFDIWGEKRERLNPNRITIRNPKTYNQILLHGNAYDILICLGRFTHEDGKLIPPKDKLHEYYTDDIGYIHKSLKQKIEERCIHFRQIGFCVKCGGENICQHYKVRKYCISCNTLDVLERRITSRMSRYGIPKSEIHILGGVQNLKEHLELQFEPWMSWENYGRGNNKWCIDHIVPLSSRRDRYELRRLFHWTNCQPLSFYENTIKWMDNDEIVLTKQEQRLFSIY